MTPCRQDAKSISGSRTFSPETIGVESLRKESQGKFWKRRGGLQVIKGNILEAISQKGYYYFVGAASNGGETKYLEGVPDIGFLRVSAFVTVKCKMVKGEGGHL